MQGQGSSIKDWRALLGGYPTIFGKNAGAGQCSKNWRALLGGYPSILQEQGTAGGRPLYLWEKHGSPNPYENPIG